MIEVKGLNEAFAKFAEDPDRERLRNLLRDHTGELNELDFKQDWQEVPKVAKHIIGIANSGGGCIVFGVKQQNGVLEPVGLPTLADKADVSNKIDNYLPDKLCSLYNVHDFAYESSDFKKIIGKSFQVLLVKDDPAHVPFAAEKDSGQVLRRNAIYVRRGTKTVEANYSELQRLLNRRLETGYSSRLELDLREHLEQLKILYEYNGSDINVGGVLLGWLSDNKDMVNEARKPLPRSFGGFIESVIEKKKRRIENELDL